MTSGCIAAAILLILLVPLPCYRTAQGRIDVADAHAVFLPHGGVVKSVNVSFGDQVAEGKELVQVRNDEAVQQVEKFEGQKKLAERRSELEREMSLRSGKQSAQLGALRAAVDASKQQLSAAIARVEALTVKAPIAGYVLPASDADRSQGNHAVQQVSIQNHSSPSVSIDTPALSKTLGDDTTRYQPWCRISPDGRIQAVLTADAQDRSVISTGSRVSIALLSQPGQVWESTVTSVSAIEQERQVVARRARYKIVCDLDLSPQGSHQNTDLLSVVGSQCEGVVHLPWQSLASRSLDWFKQLVQQ